MKIKKEVFIALGFLAVGFSIGYAFAMQQVYKFAEDVIVNSGIMDNADIHTMVKIALARMGLT